MRPHQDERAWLIALLFFGHDRINLSPDERRKMNRRKKDDIRPSPKCYTSDGECARSLAGPRYMEAQRRERNRDSFTHSDSPCPQWRICWWCRTEHPSIDLAFASIWFASNKNKCGSLLAIAYHYFYSLCQFIKPDSPVLPKRLAPFMTIWAGCVQLRPSHRLTLWSFIKKCINLSHHLLNFGAWSYACSTKNHDKILLCFILLQ